MSERSQNETTDLATLGKMIGHIRIAMLTTKDADGSLKARPMATEGTETDTGVLWFVTRLDSSKTEEIQQEQQVQVSYADPDGSTFISVSGRAHVIQDRELLEKFWQPLMKAWFEKGIDDPEAALIRVDIDSAEYWSGPSSKLVRLFGMAKAAVTGTFDQGKHGIVEVL